MTLVTNIQSFPLEILSKILIESENPYVSVVCRCFRSATMSPVFQKEFFRLFFRGDEGLKKKALQILSSQDPKHSKPLFSLLMQIFKEQKGRLLSLPTGMAFYQEVAFIKIDPNFYSLAKDYEGHQQLERFGRASGLLSGQEGMLSTKEASRLVKERLNTADLAGKDLVLKGAPGNQAISIPEEFTDIGLISMDLEYNNVTSLSESLLTSNTLRSLSLYRNRLCEIVPLSETGVTSPSALRILDLRINQLNGIPEAIWSLRQLTVLKISNNSIGAIPDQIASLDQLQELEAHDAKLSQVSSKLGELAHLSKLDLSFNALRTLPDLERTALTVVKARSNRLQNIPKLPLGIQEISFASNMLTSLPAATTTYTRLAYVDVSSNKISRVTEEQKMFIAARKHAAVYGNPFHEESREERTETRKVLLAEEPKDPKKKSAFDYVTDLVCFRFLESD